MKQTKILIIAQNWLGDALFSTPAIRAIKKKYPNAWITVISPSRAVDVFRRNPHVKDVIIYDERASIFSLGFWKTAFRLNRRGFDIAIFLHRSKTKVWLSLLVGIKERWGYEAPGRSLFLTKAIPTPKERVHHIDYFLHLMNALGIESDGRHMEYMPSAAADVELDKVFKGVSLRRDEPYIVIHVGGNWDPKRWPTEYFAQWIYLMQEKYGYPVIICGGEPEERLARRIYKRFTGRAVYSFCGKTSLGALALLLKGAKFVLSNDSGPVHLAATQGSLVLGLYGPTLPEETGPVSEIKGQAQVIRKDVGCQVPCYYKHCEYRVCLDWLLPYEVFNKSQEMLATSKLNKHEA